MYKKQLTAQKIICFAVLIACVGVFIYSLGILTDLHDSIYLANVRYADNPEKTKVKGSTVYFEMQEFNRILVRASIALIVLALFLFITNTHSRRKYYLGNYVSTLAFSVGSVAMSIWAHGQFEFYKAKYLEMDFEALQKHAEKMKTLYTDSTFWFDAHYVVFGVLLLVTALLVANLFFKMKVMKDERKLLKNGKGEIA